MASRPVRREPWAHASRDTAPRMLKRIIGAASHLLASSVQPVVTSLDELKDRQLSNALLLGKLHAVRVAALPDHAKLSQAEFRVFSQWGEDGIVQFLLSRVPTPRRFFVEFGVQNYLESNTRFLLINDNWAGLVMDSSETHIRYIQADAIYWRHELNALHAFVTAENIDELIQRHAGIEDIGILSIDIDGNDYWVWKALTCVAPRIVVVEYNSVFGSRHAVTIPYQTAFERGSAHHSNLYWGASLAALCDLAATKGYRFVGSNSAGNNAFFVRDDCAGALPALTPEDGYVESKFRESRDEQGSLTYVTGHARRELIAEMKVYDVRSARVMAVGELDE